MDEAQINHMVDRFLQWKLPNPWNPDNGISFTPYGHQITNPDVHWPIGTNLFDAGQATEMVRFMLEGLPERRADLAPIPPQPKGGDPPSSLVTPASYDDAPGSANAQPGAQWPENPSLVISEAWRAFWRTPYIKTGGQKALKKAREAMNAVLARAYAPTAPSPYGQTDDEKYQEEKVGISQIEAAYKQGWNDRESDILERAERILPAGPPPPISSPPKGKRVVIDEDVLLSAFPSLVARIRDLEAENKKLRECLTECADDLEAEVNSRAHAQLPRTTKRDLEPVVKARALLEKGEGCAKEKRRQT